MPDHFAGLKRPGLHEEQCSPPAPTFPVIRCAYYGDVDGILDELRQGGDLEETEPDGSQPLHAAVLSDSLAAVQMLLKHRVSLNSQGQGGKTPLHIACRDNSFTIVRELVAAGADINVLDIEGCTPPVVAEANKSNRALRALRGLHEEEEDVSEAPVGSPLLPLSTSNGRLLVEEGRSPQITHHLDRTPDAPPSDRGAWFGSSVDPDVDDT
uniref:Uncharacterized protein n=1 Tax=Noctiluca scintillans TaxID=2966 RepID=A0A7S1AZX1_NOCSC